MVQLLKSSDLKTDSRSITDARLIVISSCKIIDRFHQLLDEPDENDRSLFRRNLQIRSTVFWKSTRLHLQTHWKGAELTEFVRKPFEDKVRLEMEQTMVLPQLLNKAEISILYANVHLYCMCARQFPTPLYVDHQTMFLPYTKQEETLNGGKIPFVAVCGRRKISRVPFEPLLSIDIVVFIDRIVSLNDNNEL